MHCLFYRIQRRWKVLVELIPQGHPAGRTPALVAALPLILIEDVRADPCVSVRELLGFSAALLVAPIFQISGTGTSNVLSVTDTMQ